MLCGGQSFKDKTHNQLPSHLPFYSIDDEPIPVDEVLQENDDSNPE